MGHFLPLYSPNSPKKKNLQKMKQTPGDIIILHKCTKNYDQMIYSSWDMVRGRFKSQKKSKFWQNEKNAWRYHHFRYVYQKLWSEDVQFLRYAARQTDRQMDGRMDGQKKWHIEVGASPKNMKVLLNLTKDFTLLIMFNILVSK